MNWEAIIAIAEGVAALGVIGSLAYLAVQVRQNTRQARLTAQQTLVNELGRALSTQAQSRELAEVLSKGLQGLHDLNAVEKTRFLSHIGHILRVYEALYFHHIEGSLDPRIWSGFENAISEVIVYPGMQEALKIRHHHFSTEFQTFLRRQAAITRFSGIFGESDPPTEAQSNTR